MQGIADHKKHRARGPRARAGIFAILLAAALGAACNGGGGSGSGGPAPAPTGTVSGKLSIPPNNTVETEPNDDPAHAQLITSSVTVSGNASVDDAGSSLSSGTPGEPPLLVPDLFRLHAAGPVRITLSIGANNLNENDLDLILIDPATNAVIDSSAGTISTEIIETSAQGDFIVGILAFQGASAYVLNVIPIGSLSAAAGEPLPPGAAFVPGEVLVKLKPAASGERRKSAPLAARHGLAQKESFPQGVELLQVVPPTPSLQAPQKPNGTGRSKLRRGKSAENERMALTWETIRRLREDPDVAYAEANFIRQPFAVPNDPRYPLQWDYTLINLPQAWDVTTGSDAVIVAVIDTGVLHHPDLQPRLIAGYDFISDVATAGDANGVDPDPTDVGDDPKASSDPAHASSSFHGTHVAGTIAAETNNGTGVAGVTWHTKIMPLRALGRGGGSDADIAQAIRYAAGLPNNSGALPTQKARVINMSLGGPGFSQTMQDAITDARNAGVIVVAAAGNENSSAPNSPASLEGVISVSAVDINSKKAPYSNFGRTIDVAAPGGNTGADLNGDGYPDGILSTLGNDTGDFFYRFYQGTSMAAPHVAGVIALMLAVNPNLTPADVDQLLAGTHPATAQRITRDLGVPGRDDLYGHGLIDAALAVQAAKAVPGGGSQPIPTGPILTVSTTLLNFSNYLNALQLDIKNAGIGTLQITGVGADVPWLTVTPAAGTAPLTLTVSVDRTGLPDGEHPATITITSDAPQDPVRTVQVRVTVGGPTEGNVGTVFVLVVDQATHETVEEAQTGLAQGYAFTTPRTKTGTYVVVAGTDRDNDGLICDIEDACGSFPEEVTVTEGQDRPNINFQVGELASPQNAEGNPLRGKTFRRLH